MFALEERFHHRGHRGKKDKIQTQQRSTELAETGWRIADDLFAKDDGFAHHYWFVLVREPELLTDRHAGVRAGARPFGRKTHLIGVGHPFTINKTDEGEG